MYSKVILLAMNILYFLNNHNLFLDINIENGSDNLWYTLTQPFSGNSLFYDSFSILHGLIFSDILINSVPLGSNPRLFLKL